MKKWIRVTVDVVVYVVSLIGCYVSSYRFIGHIQDIIDD